MGDDDEDELQPAEPAAPEAGAEAEAEAETDQADLLAEPDPRLTKRRGRPKGIPKHPDSGRKKPPPPTTAELRGMLASIDGIGQLRRIIEGLPIRVTGPTGKPFDALPAISERLRALDIWTSRLLPSLASQELKAEVETKGEPESRLDRARTMAFVLRQAAVEFQLPEVVERLSKMRLRADGTVEMPTPTPAPPPVSYPSSPSEPVSAWQAEAEAIERRRSFGMPSPGGEPAPPAPTGTAVVALDEHRRQVQARHDERPPPGMSGPASAKGLVDGERIVTDGGCWIEYAGVTNGDGREKFWVCNHNAQRVTMCWGRDEAIAKAKELGQRGKLTK